MRAAEGPQRESRRARPWWYGEEGEAEWTLRGRDQAALDHAQKLIEEAISQAQNASSVGFLTLADRSAFPRIVGTKGANVARLRSETGAEITVGREDNTIVIVGMCIFHPAST